MRKQLTCPQGVGSCSVIGVTVDLISVLNEVFLERGRGCFTDNFDSMRSLRNRGNCLESSRFLHSPLERLVLPIRDDLGGLKPITGTRVRHWGTRVVANCSRRGVACEAADARLFADGGGGRRRRRRRRVPICEASLEQRELKTRLLLSAGVCVGRFWGFYGQDVGKHVSGGSSGRRE